MEFLKKSILFLSLLAVCWAFCKENECRAAGAECTVDLAEEILDSAAVVRESKKCGKGLNCVNGTCITPTVGTYCDDDTDCATDCKLWPSSYQCEGDARFQRMGCNTTEMKCYNWGELNEPCSGSNICRWFNMTCQSGTCLPTPITNTTSAPGLANGQPCSFTSECASGLFCGNFSVNATLSENRCQPVRNEDEACSSDAACNGTLWCYNGKCIAPQGRGFEGCSFSYHCMSGYTCITSGNLHATSASGFDCPTGSPGYCEYLVLPEGFTNCSCFQSGAAPGFGYYCGAVTDTVQKRVSYGKECGGRNQIKCFNGLTCDDGGSGGTSKCYTAYFQSPGGSCSPSSGFQACELGYLCDKRTHTCQKAYDRVCDDDADCFDGETCDCIKFGEESRCRATSTKRIPCDNSLKNYYGCIKTTADKFVVDDDDDCDEHEECAQECLAHWDAYYQDLSGKPYCDDYPPYCNPDVVFDDDEDEESGSSHVLLSLFNVILAYTALWFVH